MEFSGYKITAGAVATLLSGILVIVLYSHARKGDVAAIVILVVLAVILLILLGVAIAVGAVLVAERIRSHQFQQTASGRIENQKLLLTQQRAQNELTRGALMLAREQQKLLPRGHSLEDPLALVGVQDAIFDEIYED